jgi:integrative and conjugative element protein (TIGR02256 family)
VPERPEAGGVLLGRHLLGTSDILVDRVTEPLPGDQQSRFRFFRARRRHQMVIDRAWQESAGTQTYLGEWHTHPERVPAPSLSDRLGWHRKLLTDRFSDVMFFVIMGTQETSVWEGRRFRWPVPLRADSGL